MPVTIDSLSVTTLPQAASITSQAGEITPELVRQVADLVYAALLEELRLERERSSFLRGDRYGR